MTRPVGRYLALVTSIFSKLRLQPTPEDPRRVLAVPEFIGAAERCSSPTRKRLAGSAARATTLFSASRPGARGSNAALLVTPVEAHDADLVFAEIADEDASRRPRVDVEFDCRGAARDRGAQSALLEPLPPGLLQPCTPGPASMSGAWWSPRTSRPR
jgi:hypothetical protein